MQESRQEFVMVSLKGFIYAIGGYNGYTPHIMDTTEQYNPNANKWVKMGNMKLNIARHGHGAAVLQESMYVCGGCDDRRCERYDTITDKWTFIAQTTSARGLGVTMISDGHHVFVFGGSGDSQNTAEMYSTTASNWTQLKPLALKRWYSTAVIIN